MFGIAAAIVFAVAFIIEVTGSHINGNLFTFQSLIALGLFLLTLHIIVGSAVNFWRK